MATNRLAEVALHSRSPGAVVPVSSLGSRLQPVPVLVCQDLMQVWAVELGRRTGLRLLLQVQWMSMW